jgi:hypothetical protein
MDLTRPTPSTAARATASVLQPENNTRSDLRKEVRSEARNEERKDVRSDLRNAVRSGANASHKPLGFGLPCANCRLYYPASLDECPACNSNERVSPIVTRAIPIPQVPQAAAEPEPDAFLLEQQREAFLKEFKAQLFAADAEMTDAPVACTLGEHDEDVTEKASICKPCYDRLQERVDVFEAALHIDLKEAAQIIYDAVWADPSDPSKTYTNAASALLTELRRRSGVSSLLGPFHPLGN